MGIDTTSGRGRGRTTGGGRRRGTRTGVVVAALVAASVPGAALPAQAATDYEVLEAGQSLRAGDALLSPSGRYRLEIDAQGALQIVEDGSWLSPGQIAWADLAFQVDRLTMQEDGNLVAYGTDGTVQLTLDTRGSGATALYLEEDRALVLVDDDDDVVEELGTSIPFLLPTQALLPGDRFEGEDGTTLDMQTDGNLVLRGAPPSRPVLWSSRTDGRPGAGAVMQPDGNFVVYSSEATGRVPLFNTGTVTGGSLDFTYLLVEDTEASVRISPHDGAALSLWGSNWASDRVLAGDELDYGDRRVSRGGRCTLVLQDDDNLVQYCGPRAVFATGRPSPWPQGQPFEYSTATLQTDGNLVVRQDSYVEGAGTRILYQSGTRGLGGTQLVVQDDTNLVAAAPDGRPVWSRVTGRL